jgi:hypothetical protein
VRLTRLQSEIRNRQRGPNLRPTLGTERSNLEPEYDWRDELAALELNPETGHLYVCSADAVLIFTSSEVKYDPVKVKTGDDFLGSALNAPAGSVRRGTIGSSA